MGNCVTVLKRSCGSQQSCNSEYLQDIGHKSLGNQAVRTQKLSEQAVTPYLSLKPH